MDEKKQILICKVCDYHIGFDVSATTQIIKRKLKDSSFKNKTVKFRNKRIPYVDIFKKLNCEEGERNYLVVLNSKRGLFSIAVSAIEEIIEAPLILNDGKGNRLGNLTINDYIKSVVIFKELPVVIVDSEKIFHTIKKKKIEKK